VKICRYCRIEQPEENFEVARIYRGKTYRRHKCQTCKSARQRERIHETRAWLIALKKTLVCAQCGFSDYRALQFHHEAPTEKEFAVGDVARRGGSLKRLKAEIEKCTVLCANCHAIEHYSDSAASDM
jgi:hypothetical protein